MRKNTKRSLVLVFVVFVVALAIAFLLNPKDIEFKETGQIIEIEGTFSYVDVLVSEAKSLIDSNPDLIIIDVSPFYEEGHLPGALWYYYADGSLDEVIPTLDKEKSYLVYCHFDGPSIAGAQKLVNAGFRVYRLADHFSGWETAGYEVEY